MYVNYNLQNPITIPANNQFQNKADYKFDVDTTNDPHPMDWYNAYFELDFKITKMDNTGYAANEAVGTINGGFGLIKPLTVDFGGVRVVDTHRINHAINVKNLMDFSEGYSNKVGPTMFHYPDTNTGAVFQDYTTLALSGDAENKIPTKNAQYNEGFAKRKILLSGGATKNIILPLSRLNYFQSFEDQISPNEKVSFEITLEDDNNVIFRAAAADPGRYIITKFVLWVPKMTLNASGKQIFLEKYLKEHTWTYLKESIVTLPFQQSIGNFKIINHIRKPRHVFVWALNTTKFNDQEQNMFLFNTYNIANNRTITSAQLSLSNGVFYPQKVINPTLQITKTFRELMKYNEVSMII